MTVMKAILVVCAFLLVASVRLASGFTVGGTTSCTSDSSASLVSKVIERTTTSTSTSRPSTLLRLFDSEQEQSGIVGDGGDDVTFDSSELYKSLNKRKRAIKSGVGKRYKVCTKRGFLNVHADPRSGPFATDNITGKLEDGQIVTSVGEPFGTWVQHDNGGWSISQFEGFTWLKPVEEEELD
mmetsp:Transcript_23676/g.51300  ORF Transcript_23676/g.51300 Transcript_23676/m.51300 type:complete len:182 (-) Transcript_23676:165-710(-)